MKKLLNSSYSENKRSRVNKLKVVIIGSGAREHAIAEKFAEDKKITNIYVLPGNHGMISNKIKIKNISEYNEILKFCKMKNISLVFIGPEVPLVNGLVDLLNKNDIAVFGPTKINSKLEGSKIFSKEVMKRYNIPTAKYKKYNNADEAKTDILINDLNIVIKYDGLAGGKGVFLPEKQEEALSIIDDIFKKKIFSKKDNKIIIEERLKGVECSLMGFCNGNEIYFMPQAQDYKKKEDNDNGPNTGGMGSIAPVNILTETEMTYLKGLLNVLVKKFNYKGILYTGLMKTDNGLYVLEFNCRLGDPEAQVLINLLDSDLYKICMDCINGEKLDINWNKKSCINVVLSHESYPYDRSNNLFEIRGLNEMNENIRKYYSSVTQKGNKMYTDGGRVMSLVYLDDDLIKCYNTLYNNITIDYDEIYYRKDIGYQYISKLKKKIEPVAGILNYKESGVDIDKGNEFVNKIKEICNEYDKANVIGGFSGIVEYNGTKIAATTDGVGTKIEIAQKLNKYDTIGIDLVAMCVNDLIVQGAKPLFFLDYLAVGKLDLDMSTNIIKGINEGCKQAGCSLIGGETAEMPLTYKEKGFDLAGFSVGIIEDEVYPKEIHSGDLLLGLASTGIHSNGFSLIHKILEDNEYDLNELLTPTKIYVNDIEKIKEKFKDYIKGFSHITGGGLIENIPRVLDDEHNISITYDWHIPDVFKWIYEKSDMSIDEMLRTYNCGIGMIIIMDKDIFSNVDNEKLLSMLNQYNLIPIGLITKNKTPKINYDLIEKNLQY